MQEKHSKISVRAELLLRALLILLWAGAVVGVYYFSMLTSLSPLIRLIAYMVIDPAALLAGSFIISKKYSARPVMTALIIAVSALIFFATPMKGVVPNLIVVTAVCTVFGSGTGNIFREDVSTPKKPAKTTPHSKKHKNKRKAKK